MIGTCAKKLRPDVRTCEVRGPVERGRGGANDGDWMAVERGTVPGGLRYERARLYGGSRASPGSYRLGAGVKDGPGPGQFNRLEAPLRAHKRSHRRFDEAGIVQSRILTSISFRSDAAHTVDG